MVAPEYEWIDVGNGRLVYRRVDVRPPAARSDLPFPMVITDDMPACEHVDGNFYESKSAYRAVTKARGLIEVGNDPARLKPPKRIDRKERDKQIDAAVEVAAARVGV